MGQEREHTQDCDAASTLIVQPAYVFAFDCHVAGIHFEVLPRETPIPDHTDGRQRQIELEITCRVLLGSGTKANSAAEEVKVAEETSRTIFHEDSRGIGGATRVRKRHLEIEILKGGGLRYLPTL